jgi:energy-coupling factor transport system ATP-binding protein
MLDPLGRREVLETIHRLNRELGITVVLITHHMDECIGADRLIVMSDGEIIADGTPREVFPQVELMRSNGLDVPATVGLLYELKKKGYSVPLEALTVEECAEALYRVFKGDRELDAAD